MEINYKTKTLTDRITVLGCLEHCYYHAKKSAGVSYGKGDIEAETFFQTIAEECRNFRRGYQRKYFPNCTDELWCLGKAIEEARQRVYESDEGQADDILEVERIWVQVWSKITGEDVSGCVACAEDREAKSEG